MFKRVLITSGPTVEPIDPVRYISNRSSGKTGFHIANEARKRGISDIVYITGPSRFIPEGVTVIHVESALDMQAQLNHYSRNADVIIMAAAVSDYRVKQFFTRKIKKDGRTLVLELVKNPDLLAQAGAHKPAGQILVGFAAETDNIIQNARTKFQKKNLDLLVLNEISQQNPAFDVDDNQVYFMTAGGLDKLDKMAKADVAVHLWNRIEALKKNSADITD